MKKIEIEIKALSPLAIGRQKPGRSVSEAEDYIPGTVIRGAIASQILQEYRHQYSQELDQFLPDFSQNGGEFQSLFLDNSPAIFHNAYPTTVTVEGEEIILPVVNVIPATALSSKNKSGFNTSDPKKNGVFDTLIDRFCAEGYGHIYDPNCPVDSGRVDVFSGFYGELYENYYSPSASKRLLTRVGINRRRANSEEQVLYSIEVLNESQENNKKQVLYRGAILVANAELADSLKNFINVRSESFRLGGSTSRGLGRVKITAKEPVDAKIKLKSRIDEFNHKLKKRWNDWQVFGIPPIKESPDNRDYFTIDLQSDAILTDQWQRTTVISEEMLKKWTGLVDSDLKLEMAYSSYDYRSGWNAAWGLMKDIELVTNKGGVYLFSTSQIDSWRDKLEEIEILGVGERTFEGFGKVQICNDFHLVFRENAV